MDFITRIFFTYNDNLKNIKVYPDLLSGKRCGLIKKN